LGKGGVFFDVSRTRTQKRSGGAGRTRVEPSTSILWREIRKKRKRTKWRAWVVGGINQTDGGLKKVRNRKPQTRKER